MSKRGIIGRCASARVLRILLLFVTVSQFDGRAAIAAQPLVNALTPHDAVNKAGAPSLRERLNTGLESRLANPDLDVLLMGAGGLLTYVEFNMPGTVVPGAIGTLCLLLGAFGISQFPIRHTAVAVLIAALAMALLETRLASRGALAAAGTGCLIFGLTTLVDSPVPDLRVHLLVATSAGIGFGAISFSLARIARRARRNKMHGGQGLVLLVDAMGEPE